MRNLLLLLLASCTAPTRVDGDTPSPDSGEKLLAYLAGSFDTREHAQADPDYLPILLVHCRIDAPELGKNVLYVEQTRDGAKAPYRQRVYVIDTLDATHASSRVFELVRPAEAVRLCDAPSRVTIGAADVQEKAGCAVTMERQGDRFEGSTHPRACLSSFQGATYTTSVVTVDREEIRSWDRGYDGHDAQVWGATKGPYRFKRRTPMEE